MKTNEILLKERRLQLDLLRNRYQIVGTLFEEMQVNVGQDREKDHLYRQVSSLIRELKVDKDGFLPMQEVIDTYLDAPVRRLRNDLPSLNERDLLLFCYLVADLPPRVISTLMGLSSVGAVHVRKYRLVRRLGRLPVSKSKTYLRLVPDKRKTV